jgi:hypothetical protein
MYSLFVSHQVEDQAKSAVDISKSRFLEYTSDTISNQLESLSNEAIDCMCLHGSERQAAQQSNGNHGDHQQMLHSRKRGVGSGPAQESLETRVSPGHERAGDDQDDDTDVYQHPQPALQRLYEDLSLRAHPE